MGFLRFGMNAHKLPGEKGNSLMIVTEEAKVVQMIFDMYGQQGMSYNAIVYKLWKLVLKRVTVYRSPDDKLEDNIYPNLPK